MIKRYRNICESILSEPNTDSRFRVSDKVVCLYRNPTVYKIPNHAIMVQQLCQIG